MNATGTAAGYTYYQPLEGFSYSEPPVTSTGAAIDLLEPACTTAKSGCMYDTYAYTLPSGQSRSIDAAGTVFAYALNQTSGQFIEYTGGTRPTYAQFTLPLDGGYGAGNVRGIDDKGDVVYNEFDPKTSKTLSWTYSPSTKKAHNLGALPGSSCTQYIPLYINGPGRVLGYTAGCSFASDQVYWTADSTNGIVAISFDHRAYYSAYPELINDLGQIVVDLTTTQGKHHWGILVPPAKL